MTKSLRLSLILLGILVTAGSAVQILAAQPSPAPAPRPLAIRLDGAREGRTFEGIGTLSAGAATRLLIDYPEPARSQILDLLFKPNYGAALHHLKVEVGGDVNSTMGCEPSHMHTRDDENYRRGYEWWLMKEAKRRNPAILLDCLEWGTPGWIGGGKFYSQDNADYLVKFIRGAKSVHGLDMNYVGIWNESGYDTAWIKLLRATLDRNGLRTVKIVAADEVNAWTIVERMKADPALAAAIQVVGAHYPNYASTAAAQQCGKPLWATEDVWGAQPGWGGGKTVAKLCNRNYIQGKMTKTVIWALIDSYYDNLPWPGCGMITANTPWSGHYEVQPEVWAAAHTTQFAQPGWKYLAGPACGLLPGGGSYVTLKSTNGTDYSVILETVDAREPQPITLELSGGLSAQDVHVWRTNRQEQFVHLKTLRPAAGTLAITLEPGAIYTLSTTTGQKKGTPPVPPARPFPLPYREDFQTYEPGSMPKYFGDQGGCFEVVRRADGKGRSLRQVMAREGIRWHYHCNPPPETFVGDTAWRDYTVSADVLIEKTGSVCLFGRVAAVTQDKKPPGGYCLKVDQTGKWELSSDKKRLAAGQAAFTADTWHTMKLVLAGDTILAVLDGSPLAKVTDTAYHAGMMGLGSGWNHAQFAHVSVGREKGDSPHLCEAPSGPFRQMGTVPFFPSRRPAAKVTAEPAPYGAAVKIDGRLFTEYLTRSGTKPILWPILGPTGKPMTRPFPMASQPGETRDHPHQRSLWFTFGSVNGIDFWSEAGPKIGSIEHREFVKIQSGPQAVIVTRNDWLGPGRKKICEDRRTFCFGVDGPTRWIDLAITLTASEGPVTLGDTKEGALGLRVADSMRVDAKPGGHIVNSRGQRDAAAWGKPAEWVDYYGPVNGQTLGIAILNHPASFRFPTGWSVRPYGLFAANPFARAAFTDKGESQPHPGFTLAAGKSLDLRFRILLHRGDPREGKVAEAFAAFSHLSGEHQ